ncbi:MAG: hypothetical protein U0935_11355 [Pirellulales bacterium]
MPPPINDPLNNDPPPGMQLPGMPPPGMQPPPAPPMPSFTGTGTEADPFTVTTFLGTQFKQVVEQWDEWTTGDNYAHEENQGNDYYRGDAWVRGSEGSLTFFYQLIGNDWVLMNCGGMKMIDVNTETQSIAKEVNPWEQFWSKTDRTVTTHTLGVSAPAVIVPGLPPVDATIANDTYSHSIGQEWNRIGANTLKWDLLTTSVQNFLSTGWIEEFEALEGGGMQIKRTTYWIEYEDGEPVQRESVSVMSPPSP